MLVVVARRFWLWPVPFSGRAVRLCWCSALLTRVSYATVVALSGWNRWTVGLALEFCWGLSLVLAPFCCGEPSIKIL